MFGLGFSEILLILAVALIFVGPDKLPELAQKLGRLVWQVRHSAEELRKEISLPSSDELKSMRDEITALRKSTLGKFDEARRSPQKVLLDSFSEPARIELSGDSEEKDKTCEELERESQANESTEDKTPSD